MSVTHSQILTKGFGIGKSANVRSVAAPPEQFRVRQPIDYHASRRLLEAAKLVFERTVGRTVRVKAAKIFPSNISTVHVQDSDNRDIQSRKKQKNNTFVFNRTGRQGGEDAAAPCLH